MPTQDALFKSLADPTRRGLLERLMTEGELTVGALTGPSGVSQPAVSKHLIVLKDAGLVTERRQGRRTHYSAAPAGLAPLAGWMALYSRFWEGRIDALEDLLNRMDQ
jgi:DNA-binding transcriptional ArsR family regulator